MDEPVDVYSDQFQISVGPYGCTLNFMVTSSTPSAPGMQMQAQRAATVRMSPEHLKVMTFLLHRQLITYEKEAGVSVGIPNLILNGLGIGLEDWNSFWRIKS